MLKNAMIAVVIVAMLSFFARANKLSDPTAPPNLQQPVPLKASQGLPRLQAVLLGPQRTGAILNQQFVALHQRINEYVLVQVHQDYVVLVKANQRYRLKLDKVTVKHLSEQGQQ